jgi:hypothetical protein
MGPSPIQVTVHPYHLDVSMPMPRIPDAENPRTLAPIEETINEGSQHSPASSDGSITGRARRRTSGPPVALCTDQMEAKSGLPVTWGEVPNWVSRHQRASAANSLTTSSSSIARPTPLQLKLRAEADTTDRELKDFCGRLTHLLVNNKVSKVIFEGTLEVLVRRIKGFTEKYQNYGLAQDSGDRYKIKETRRQVLLCFKEMKRFVGSIERELSREASDGLNIPLHPTPKKARSPSTPKSNIGPIRDTLINAPYKLRGGLMVSCPKQIPVSKPKPGVSAFVPRRLFSDAQGEAPLKLKSTSSAFTPRAQSNESKRYMTTRWEMQIAEARERRAAKDAQKSTAARVPKSTSSAGKISRGNSRDTNCTSSPSSSRESTFVRAVDVRKSSYRNDLSSSCG